MILTDLQALIDCYGLGEMRGEPLPVLGGRINKIWRIPTSSGIYAVKRLAIDIQDKELQGFYRLSEQYANSLQLQGFPAVAALWYENNPLYITQQSCYLVYPWIEGNIILPPKVTTLHAEKIGAALARLHNAPITDHRVLQTDYRAYSAQEWSLLSLQAQSLPYAKQFASVLKRIIRIDHYANELYHGFRAKNVICHGDIDPYNVLWLADQSFAIIDWELLNRNHPLIDLAATMLYWSLSSPQCFRLARAQALLNAYRIINPIELDALPFALAIVLGLWLRWFIFNLKRAVDDETDNQLKKISIHEAQKTLNTVIFLDENLPNVVEQLILDDR